MASLRAQHLRPRDDQIGLNGFTKITDGSTYRMLIKTRLDQYAKVKQVLFFIPGNPGVASAYIPWLNVMSDRLGEGCLIVFSGHLGHLQEADKVRDFTCDENIEHQSIKIKEIYECVKGSNPDTIKNIKFYLCGHSAGAYFILEAAMLLMKANSDLTNQITLIFYCGTVVEFGSTGKLKALIAATQAGVSWVNMMKRSNWVQNYAKESAFLQQMMDEFTENFIGNMSTLTRDELKELPTNRLQRIKEIKDLSVPTFFLFAAHDSYVPKTLQAQIYELFGPDHVFIGQDWWHAFCLQSIAFRDTIEITESIVRKGCIPKFYRDKAIAESSWRWSGLIFSFQSALASVIVALWTLPGAVKTSCTRRKCES